MSKKMKQSLMFKSGEDLPLFTGTAMTADDQVFKPAEEGKQTRLAGMEPTFDELARARQDKIQVNARRLAKEATIDRHNAMQKRSDELNRRTK